MPRQPAAQHLLALTYNPSSWILGFPWFLTCHSGDLRRLVETGGVRRTPSPATSTKDVNNGCHQPIFRVASRPQQLAPQSRHATDPYTKRQGWPPNVCITCVSAPIPSRADQRCPRRTSAAQPNITRVQIDRLDSPPVLGAAFTCMAILRTWIPYICVSTSFCFRGWDVPASTPYHTHAGDCFLKTRSITLHIRMLPTSSLLFLNKLTCTFCDHCGSVHALAAFEAEDVGHSGVRSSHCV
jgi:hypothetical protein